MNYLTELFNLLHNKFKRLARMLEILYIQYYNAIEKNNRIKKIFLGFSFFGYNDTNSGEVDIYLFKSKEVFNSSS